MELKMIFLIILGTISIAYFITMALKKEVLQAILKGFLMPLVLAVYISGAGPGNVFWPIVMALIFAWIGDIALVKISNVLWFKIGLASFLIGHIFYCIAMYGFMQPLNIPVFIISILAAAFFGVIAFRAVKPDKQMKIPVIVYEAIILTMVIFASQLFITQLSVVPLFGILVFTGSICFLVSDTLLAFSTFRNINASFPVMVTYIAAQLLITLGFCIAVI